MSRSPLLPLVLLLACNGSIVATGGAGGAGGGGAGGQGAQGGYSECVSPSGWKICGLDGGPDCPVEDCPGICTNLGIEEIGQCLYDGTPPFDDSEPCADGNVRVQLNPGEPHPQQCRSFELGVLYANAGYSDKVRYVDGSLFSGQPIPDLTGCPDHPLVCGGDCAPCPAGRRCTGRSPLHPFGICVLVDSNWGCDPGPASPCDAGDGCFTFTVEPEAQPSADNVSRCLPEADCLALTTLLPGGGTCEVP